MKEKKPEQISPLPLSPFEKRVDQSLSNYLEDEALRHLTCGCSACGSKARNNISARLFTTDEKVITQGVSLFAQTANRIHELKTVKTK